MSMKARYQIGVLNPAKRSVRQSTLVHAAAFAFAVALALPPKSATAQTDYFLETAASNLVHCVSPDGGRLGDLQPEHTVVQYWNVPKVVMPGQTVYASLSYAWTNNIGQGSVVYKTVLAEWQPNSPIAILENGELQGSPREVRKDFAFTAPTTPGTYRMRLAMTWAFQGIQHFYGDGPLGNSFNPGVGHFSEVQVTVAPLRPTFVSTFGNTTVAPSGSVTLAVDALGGQPLSYLWLWNGSPLATVEPTLTIPSANMSNAGTYCVIVSNSFGAVTNCASLSVLDLKMFAGLILAGPVGASYRIEYQDALGGGSTWQTLTTIQLSTSSMVWFDMDSPYQPKRFYRAVPLP